MNRFLTPGQVVRAALACLPLATNADVLRGTVRDACTRGPVPYVEVAVPGEDLRVLTDSLGEFHLTVSDGEATVTIQASRIGYAAREWSVSPTAREVTFWLRPAAIRLDGVTVSAARTPLPVKAAGAVTVVGLPQLIAGGGTDPSDAVRRLSSALAQDYANYTSVRLRGASTEHTLIALDGVSQNSSQNGTFDLSTVPLAAVERLEVARGGSSAVFGSSAVGGVLNIITPAPDRLGAGVKGSLGSYGRRSLDFSHTNWIAPLGYLVAGQTYSCRNDFTWRDSLDSLHTMHNADLARRALLAKGRFASGPHTAGLLGEFSATARGAPGTTDWPSDSARRDDTRAQLIGNYSVQASDLVRASARGHYSRSWQNYRDPAWAVHDTHAVTAAGAALDGSWQATKHTDITLSGEAAAEGLHSTAINTAGRRTLAGILQFRVQALGFDVTHVLRYEWLSNEATLLDSTRRRSEHRVLSPKVTATFSRWSNLDLYTSLGRSFRAPSFNALYWPADAYTYGNPRLRPETGGSYELGAKARPAAGLSCQATGYYSRLHDLIQWQMDSLGRSSPVNISSAQIVGAEIEAAYETRTVGASLNTTLASARSDTTELPYRPRLAGSAAAWYEPAVPVIFPRITIRASYTGSRMANDTLFLPGFVLTDMEMRIRPRLGRVELDAGAGIRNLLDAGYETILGYPNPGRNWYAELGLRL